MGCCCIKREREQRRIRQRQNVVRMSNRRSQNDQKKKYLGFPTQGSDIVIECPKVELIIIIKYKMSFSLGNSLIAIKLRQEMYLKHLREVQKINNRQNDNNIKNFKQHRSISQVHRHNKNNANKFKINEQKRKIEQTNRQMKKKILCIKSQHEIKQNKYRYLENTQKLQKTDIYYYKKKKHNNNIEQMKQKQKYKLPKLNKSQDPQIQVINHNDN